MRLLPLFATLLLACQGAFSQTMHVALFFDDGPSANTERLIGILSDAGVTATFNLIGTNVQKNPQAARAIADADFAISCHSLEHKVPFELSDAELAHDIVAGRDAIADVTGKAPYWYWPPYVAVDPRMDAIIEGAGMKRFTFVRMASSVDYEASVSAEMIVENVLRDLGDGCVLLFHEWRSETLDVMPGLIAELKARGCVFVTAGELVQYVQDKGL